ncbi:hypothetical protein BU16DRAFT_83331 [Lophium mytilinum]|uniref:C2H2-type domain-containing protein n=1 Tax=Lophium mytilinum TaxID=390894 RepID=A0A6A6QMD0_9PEZI|nr:hypothetical protein BU16DRAFT_83331 [Lophium mytilinum]
MDYSLSQFSLPLPDTIDGQLSFHTPSGVFDDLNHALLNSSQESISSGILYSPSHSSGFESDYVFGTTSGDQALFNPFDAVTDAVFDEADLSGLHQVAGSTPHTTMPANSFWWPPNGSSHVSATRCLPKATWLTLTQTALSHTAESQPNLANGFNVDSQTPSDLHHYDLHASKYPVPHPTGTATLQSTVDVTAAVTTTVNQAIVPSTQTGPFHCKESKCGAIFPQHKSFQQHIKTHEKPHKCPHKPCEWAFRLRKDLVRHENTHGISSEPGRQIRLGSFSYCRHAGCPSSRKGFSRHDNLLRHYRNHHTENTEPGEGRKERKRSTRQKG